MASALPADPASSPAPHKTRIGCTAVALCSMQGNEHEHALMSSLTLSVNTDGNLHRLQARVFPMPCGTKGLDDTA